jgi:hypothetical protein
LVALEQVSQQVLCGFSSCGERINQQSNVSVKLRDVTTYCRKLGVQAANHHCGVSVKVTLPNDDFW